MKKISFKMLYTFVILVTFAVVSFSTCLSKREFRAIPTDCEEGSAILTFYSPPDETYCTLGASRCVKVGDFNFRMYQQVYYYDGCVGDKVGPEVYIGYVSKPVYNTLPCIE